MAAANAARDHPEPARRSATQVNEKLLRIARVWRTVNQLSVAQRNSIVLEFARPVALQKGVRNRDVSIGARSPLRTVTTVFDSVATLSWSSAPARRWPA